MEALQDQITCFLTPFMPKRIKNGPPSANQVASTDEPRRGHAVCTLRVHPPTFPYPTLFAEAEPKDIANWHHEAESLMTDISAMDPKELSELHALSANTVYTVRELGCVRTRHRLTLGSANLIWDQTSASENETFLKF